MKELFAVLILLFSCAFTTRGQNTAPVYEFGDLAAEFPFRFVAGTPVVTVHIDGSDYSFILDTGGCN